MKLLAGNENSQDKTQKIMQTQRQEIYPGSVLVTYVQSPSKPLEIFLFVIWIHPKPTPVHHLTKHPLPNMYNSSYTKKTTTPCTILLFE